MGENEDEFPELEEDMVKDDLIEMLEELKLPNRIHTDYWMLKKVEGLYCTWY